MSSGKAIVELGEDKLTMKMLIDMKNWAMNNKSRVVCVPKQNKKKKERKKMAAYVDFNNDMLKIRVDEVSNGWEIWDENGNDGVDEYIAKDSSGIKDVIDAIIKKHDGIKAKAIEVKNLQNQKGDINKQIDELCK